MWNGTPDNQQIVGQSLGTELVNVMGAFPGHAADVCSILRGVILDFRLRF